MAKKKYEVDSHVKIKFDNPAAAYHFMIWLCEQGEQQYWDWMEVRESEEDGDITAIDFDYHGGTSNAKKFGKQDIIAKCGRLTKNDKKG